MKKLLFLFLSLSGLFSKGVKAQGTGNIFNQGSSKIRLMLAQIAEYQTYLHEIRQGYAVAEKGLNKAKELKGGTLALHTSYFNSLEQVNPVIAANPKAKACGDLQQQITALFNREIAWQQKQQLISAEELDYIKAVYQNLVAKCKTDMDELNAVLTPGKLQMTDHDRIDRIDHIYTAMQDKKAFAISFTGHCRQMANDRKKSKLNNEQLRKMYGVG